jgi:hypothetical protein
MEFLFTRQLEVEKARCNGTSTCNSGSWPVAVAFRRLPLRQACLHPVLDGHPLTRVPCRQPVGANPVGFGTVYKFRTGNVSSQPGRAKNIHRAPFKLHCRPENRAQSAPGPSPRCSTLQYTFPGNLRPVCPFESEGEKLQTTNKIRHFKHVC